MALSKWISAEPSAYLGVLLSTIATYGAIIFYCRIAGLRSFSKMSAADFAMTVAVGSLFASTISSPQPSLLLGLFAVGILFLGQWVVAKGRSQSEGISSVVDNDPILLMDGPEILFDNLRKTKVTRNDLMAKLREANVLNRDQVRAVVFETTGDISVLHTADSDVELEDEILLGVKGVESEIT